MGSLFPCGSLNRFIYRLLRGAPFRSERDPVGRSEWLLRRVPGKNADYYDRSLPRPLQPVAFRPNEQDTDGISLFREMFVSPAALGLSGRKPPYYVFRLRAGEVSAIGLEIRPSPDPEQPPGHVVLPPLCYKKKRAAQEKEAVSNMQAALADAARIAFDIPKDDDPGPPGDANG